MEPVSPAMRAVIGDELARLAREEGARILLAVESGARAWGFHSADSDYDVRFVYARPIPWHLRLDGRRDVIERPVSGDLDLAGWELGKALRLALGGNAVVGEWLQSPIRYLAQEAAVAEVADFCRRTLTPAPVAWHYRRLAERQMESLRGADGQVRLKRYLYAIRPVLALRWMRLTGGAMPPMHMAALRGATDLPGEVEAYLDALIARKLVAGEMGSAPTTHPAVDALIAAELAAAAERAGPRAPRPGQAAWDEAAALNLRFAREAGA